MAERTPQLELPETLAWDDWRSQLRHSIRTLDELKKWINVTEEEERAIAQSEEKYRWAITPYYASLMDRDDPNCPVRLQSVPHTLEFKKYPGASPDPVDDVHNLKTKRVIHKYPDRAIILTTDTCSVYCRHCTRKYHTTNLDGTYFGSDEDKSWERDFEYIENTPQIRDVLLTGGDPLTLTDKNLERIISRLRQIPHVEIIRVGSRYPVVLPQRITLEFCQMLEKYHPIWLNTHFNHAKEITPEAAQAVDKLIRHGVIVQNQTVLMRNINDNVETMRELLTELLKIRVRPYYIFHCDNVIGVSHFSTSVEKGLEVLRGLTGFITGFAVPQYVLTTPLGKIPLNESGLFKQEGDYWVQNYKGERMNVRDFLLEPDMDS